MNSSLTPLAVPHPRLGLSAATVIEANGVSFAKKDTLLAHTCAASSKLRYYGLLTLLKDFLRRAGQPFQSRSWPTKPAEKGRNVYVMVVRTLQERVRGNLRLVRGDGADVLI